MSVSLSPPRPRYRIEDLATWRTIVNIPAWQCVTLARLAEIVDASGAVHRNAPLVVSDIGLADLCREPTYENFLDPSGDVDRAIGFVGVLLGLEVYALNTVGGARCAILANPQEKRQ